MLNEFSSKPEKQRCYIGIAICAVVFLFGYYILNFISTREKVPLGNTLYILIGTTLMAISSIIIFLIIRHLNKLEKKLKKRRSSKIVFLKNLEKATKKE
jgi:large-conductance mechanosensitive channel